MGQAVLIRPGKEGFLSSYRLGPSTDLFQRIFVAEDKIFYRPLSSSSGPAWDDGICLTSWQASLVFQRVALEQTIRR